MAGDMNLLKQAKLMQDRLMSLQNELKERIEEGSAGGGAVKAYVNGMREVMGVKIDKEVVDPDDIETLEELVAAAFKNALEKAKELENQRVRQADRWTQLAGSELLDRSLDARDCEPQDDPKRSELRLTETARS